MGKYLEKLIDYGYVDGSQITDVDVFMDSFIDATIVDEI